MAKKEFVYRGKSLQELQEMSINELGSLLPSRQRRKIKRGFTKQEQTCMKNLEVAKKPVKTHCRDMIVLPFMVGKAVHIHTGKEFVPVTIMPEMIGHTFGELTLTRKRVAHNAPGIGATKSSGAISVK